MLSKIEAFLGRVFIVIISASLTFACVEKYYRLNKKKMANESKFMAIDEVNHWPRPFVMAAGKPGIGDLNKLGYRGYLPSAIKPKNEFRIFVIGGSTVYYGNPSISSALEERFHKNGYLNVKVSNFGNTSSISRQDLVRILVDVAGYEPDLIIQYGGYNDIIPSLDPRINYPHRFMLYEANPIMTVDIEKYNLGVALAFGSQFVRENFESYIFRALTDPFLKDAVFDYDEGNSRRIDAYIQNLRLSRALSKDLGADFVSFFQPMLAFKTKFSKEESGVYHPQDIENLNQLRRLVREKIVKFKSEFEFRDISNLFENTSERVYYDQIHVLSNFNEIIAAEIYSNILGTVLRRSKKTERNSEFHEKLFPEEYFIR